MSDPVSKTTIAMLDADAELAAAAAAARDDPSAHTRLMIAWNKAKVLWRKAESDETPVAQATTYDDVSELAQVIRTAHLMAWITPWGELGVREKAPYVASAIAAIRHLKGSAENAG